MEANNQNEDYPKNPFFNGKIVQRLLFNAVLVPYSTTRNMLRVRRYTTDLSKYEKIYRGFFSGFSIHMAYYGLGVFIRGVIPYTIDELLANACQKSIQNFTSKKYTAEDQEDEDDPAEPAEPAKPTILGAAKVFVGSLAVRGLYDILRTPVMNLWFKASTELSDEPIYTNILSSTLQILQFEGGVKALYNGFFLKLLISAVDAFSDAVVYLHGGDLKKNFWMYHSVTLVKLGLTYPIKTLWIREAIQERKQVYPEFGEDEGSRIVDFRNKRHDALYQGVNYDLYFILLSMGFGYIGKKLGELNLNNGNN